VLCIFVAAKSGQTAQAGLFLDMSLARQMERRGVARSTDETGASTQTSVGGHPQQQPGCGDSGLCDTVLSDVQSFLGGFDPIELRTATNW